MRSQHQEEAKPETVDQAKGRPDQLKRGGTGALVWVSMQVSPKETFGGANERDVDVRFLMFLGFLEDFSCISYKRQKIGSPNCNLYLSFSS